MKSSRVSLAILVGTILTAVSVISAQDALTQSETNIVDIEFSPGGDQLVRIYASGTWEVVDSQSGQIQHRESGSLALYAAQASWSCDGQRLAIGKGTAVEIWNANRWHLEQSLQLQGIDEIAHLDGINIAEGIWSLGWNLNCSSLLAVTISAYLYVWNAMTYEQIGYFNLPTDASSMVWLADGLSISDGTKTIDIETMEMQRRNTEDRIGGASNDAVYQVTAAAVNPQNGRLAIGDNRGSIAILDGSDLAVLGFFPAVFGREPLSTTSAIAWSPSGEELLIVGVTAGAMLFNPDTGAMTPIGQIDGGLYAGDWSSAGQIAVGGGTPDLAAFGSIDMEAGGLTAQGQAMTANTIQFQFYRP